MRLYKRGRYWWTAHTENGRTVRESTGCETKDAAERIRKQRELALADPAHHATQAATLADAVETFLRDLRKKGAPDGTVNMYECKAGHLLRLLPARLVDIDVTSVDDYFRTRDEDPEEQSPSASTLYKEWVTLSRVLKSAQRRGLYKGDVRMLKPEWLSPNYVPRTTFLTWEMVPHLLAELEPARREVVAFILATGARWGEAMRMQPGDIDRTRWHVLIRGTKTKRAAATIGVPEAMRGLLDHVEGPFAAWGNVLRDLEVACRRAQRRLAEEVARRPVVEGSHTPLFPRVTPNDLRRTFGSLLVQAGAPLDIVAKLMRHATTAMAYAVYGQHTPDTLAALASGRVPNVYQAEGARVDAEDASDSATPTFPGFLVGRAGHDPATYGLKVPSKPRLSPEKQASRDSGVRRLYQAPKLYPLPAAMGRAVWASSTRG